MSRPSYKKALEDAIAEYESLRRERDALEARMAQLAQTIGSLSRLCGLKAGVELGITDACRAILRSSKRALTPTEIRDQLQAMGFDLSKYANGLAAIHTVLKRLHGAGEADLQETPERKQGYAWKGTSYVPFDIATLMKLWDDKR
ncbi:MAG: hypothetical protein IRZ16_12635 [Myxococcaceae bacterium]|nr:hypothetical protein [Myxococcaceae bacterium]